MYGAHLLGGYDESPQALSYRIGKNSEVFTKYDVVSIQSGFLQVVSGGTQKPAGICDVTKTMASDNQTVAQVQVPYYSAFNDFTFEMDFNNSSAAQGDVGKFYQLTGGTGVQLVNQATASATSGQVVLLDMDPRKEGSTTRGLFRFAKTDQAYTLA